MAIQIRLRQGTTTEHNTFMGAVGEVTVDTNKKTLVVHDGVTVGGTVLAKVSEVPSLVPQATETALGVAKIATTAIAQAGINDTDFITPLKLKAVSFGVGQTVRDVTSGRVLDTTYTNNTGKAIFLIVVLGVSGSGFSYSVVTVDGLSYSGSLQQQSGMYSTNFAIIPNGSQYSVSRMGNAGGVSKWLELRT